MAQVGVGSICTRAPALRQRFCEDLLNYIAGCAAYLSMKWHWLQLMVSASINWSHK